LKDVLIKLLKDPLIEVKEALIFHLNKTLNCLNGTSSYPNTSSGGVASASSNALPASDEKV
jgi:hypothetical protein